MDFYPRIHVTPVSVRAERTEAGNISLFSSDAAGLSDCHTIMTPGEARMVIDVLSAALAEPEAVAAE